MCLSNKGQDSRLPRYSIGPLGFHEFDKGKLSRMQLVERVKSRFLMAVRGGVVVIAPVRIMTLKPSIVGDLVITLVSTMVFAIVMINFATDASRKDM